MAKEMLLACEATSKEAGRGIYDEKRFGVLMPYGDEKFGD